MNEELEKRLSRLQMHAPSEELDQRIAELLREASQPTAVCRPGSTVQQNWKLLCATAVGFLVIGFGLGLSAAGLWPEHGGKFQTVGVEQKLSDAERFENRQISGLHLEVQEPSTVSGMPANERQAKAPDDFRERTGEPLSQQKTTILGERWFEGPNGRLARGYLTATRQRIWKYDEQSKSLRAHELTIPRLVVSSPPGI